MAYKCISNFAQVRPPSVTPTSLHYSLQLYLLTRTITDSMFTRSWPSTVSPSSLDDSLQVHLQTHSIMSSMCIFEFTWLRPASSHDYGLQVHRQTRLITACKFTRSSSPGQYLPICSITASKAISQLARLWLPSSHDHCLQAGPQICWITASDSLSQFTGFSFSGAPRISLNHCLQPVQIYCV